MMWKMRDMVINEVAIIENVMQGGEIPSCYNAQTFIDRLYRYYMFEVKIDDKEKLERISYILESNGIVFNRDVLEQMLKDKAKNEKSRPLRKFEGIKIYKEEVNLILDLETVREQKIMFGMLLMQKVKNLTREATDVFYDRWDDVFLYTDIGGQELKNKILHSLHQKGYITVPLFERGIHINILHNDGEVAYNITDNELMDYTKYFEKMVNDNKIFIMEIPINGEPVVYTESIRKVASMKGISSSNICKAIHLEKLTIGGSMWLKVNFAVAQDEELQQKLKDYYMKLGSKYRKMKKQYGIGYMLITNELFKLLIQHKQPQGITVSVGKPRQIQKPINIEVKIENRVNIPILF